VSCRQAGGGRIADRLEGTVHDLDERSELEARDVWVHDGEHGMGNVHDDMRGLSGVAAPQG